MNALENKAYNAHLLSQLKFNRATSIEAQKEIAFQYFMNSGNHVVKEIKRLLEVESNGGIAESHNGRTLPA